MPRVPSTGSSRHRGRYSIRNHGVAPGTEWHAGADRGAAPGPRLDGYPAANQVKSLPHADKPQALTVDGFMGIEAYSIVAHGELNFCLCAVQSHCKLPDATVLGRILQSFL